MEIRYKDLEDNGFTFDPDESILAGVLSMCDGFLAGEIKRVFNPKTIIEVFMGTKEEREQILMPYDGVTWENVFSSLKCREIHGFVLTDDVEGTNGLYLSYLEQLHRIDAKGMKEVFSGHTKEIFGILYVDIWEKFKRQLFQGLNENKGDGDLFKLAKSAMRNGIKDAISKYEKALQENGMNVNSSIEGLLIETGDIYEKVIEDPKAVYKTTYAAVVKAAEILVCNPEYLPFGERLASAIKYLMGGASICAGKAVTDMLKKRNDKTAELLGEEGLSFVSTFVSSALSYLLVIQIDRNPVMQSLIGRFNNVATITGDIGYYKKIAEQFEAYAAELENLDLEKLKREIEEYNKISNDLQKISSAEELNKYLMEYYKKSGLELPWGNREFEDYWADSNRQLIFN